MATVLSSSKLTVYIEPTAELVRLRIGGGVGDLRDGGRLDQRFLDLRVKIPAHERIFFCFLLAFLVGNDRSWVDESDGC